MRGAARCSQLLPERPCFDCHAHARHDVRPDNRDGADTRGQREINHRSTSKQQRKRPRHIHKDVCVIEMKFSGCFFASVPIPSPTQCVCVMTRLQSCRAAHHASRATCARRNH